MGWRYQAKRVKAPYSDDEYEYTVVEAYPELQEEGGVIPHTENTKFFGETPQALAEWLREAADDIERYDVIIYEDDDDTHDWPDEERMDIIGQNGNNGEHYDNA